MGDIADDMIEGRSCSQCGAFFHDPNTGEIYEHGYPVVCYICWNRLTKEEREGVYPAEVGTM